jgi:hypothetical protein
MEEIYQTRTAVGYCGPHSTYKYLRSIAAAGLRKSRQLSPFGDRALRRALVRWGTLYTVQTSFQLARPLGRLQLLTKKDRRPFYRAAR